MKKTVALILIALPIFLIISISLAGSILGVFGTIKPESIRFLDDSGNEITELTLNKNVEYQLNVEVMPEKASDKRVNYYYNSDESEGAKIEVSAAGLIRTLDFGSASITVTTADGRVQKSLDIEISDKAVTGIVLPETLTMKLGGLQEKLIATIIPSTAENKKVIWESSDPSKVKVDLSGNLTAYAETEPDQPVIITATTEDGNFTAECKVVITASEIFFVRLNETTPVTSDRVIVVKQPSVNLTDYILILTDLFDIQDVEFSIISGDSAALEDNNILIFSQQGKTVYIKAEAKVDGSTYLAEARFRYDA